MCLCVHVSACFHDSAMCWLHDLQAVHPFQANSQRLGSSSNIIFHSIYMFSDHDRTHKISRALSSALLAGPNICTPFCPVIVSARTNSPGLRPAPHWLAQIFSTPTLYLVTVERTDSPMHRPAPHWLAQIFSTPTLSCDSLTHTLTNASSSAPLAAPPLSPPPPSSSGPAAQSSSSSPPTHHSFSHTHN